MGTSTPLTLALLLAQVLAAQPVVSPAGRWDLPVGTERMAAAKDGRLYLAIPSDHKVGTARQLGEPVVWSGGLGWGGESFDTPDGLATDGLSVFVSDRGNHRIVRLDRGLRFLSELRTRDTSYVPARFAYPAAVAVTGRGLLALVDGDAHDVVAFGPEGRFRWRAGRDLPDGRQLRSPTALAVDEEEFLYVLDGADVRRLDVFGNESGAWTVGSPGRGVAASNGWIAVAAPDTLYLISVSDSRAYSFGRQALDVSAPPGPLFDVCWIDGGLLLLSEGRLDKLECSGVRDDR